MAIATMSLGVYSATRAHLMPINIRTQDTAEARNQMTREALRHGAEWLLWIDSDMVFPADALLRLLGRQRDIIGADYRRRAPPYPRIGQPIGPVENGMVEVGMIGLGLLLIRAAILREMGEPPFIRMWALEHAKPDNPSGFSTEDGYLCGHARHLGHRIWCDLDLSAEVGHICEKPVPWDMDATNIPGVACLPSSA